MDRVRKFKRSPGKRQRVQCNEPPAWQRGAKDRWAHLTLPDLSTKVFNFCTMSVFRNNQVQTGMLSLNPQIRCRYFYLAISTFLVDYSGYIWWVMYVENDSMGIDLTLVSKPKPKPV